MLNLWKILGTAASAARHQLHLAMPVMVALGVVFILAAIWWLGPAWHWKDYQPLGALSLRITASAVTILLPLLLWAWRVQRRYRQWQAEQRRLAAVEQDACLRDLERQQQNLDASLAALRKQLLHDDIYRLPWYLVLGSEGSGKSSLVARLEDPVLLPHADEGPLAGAQDQVLCWLGHEAVLIDTPGSFVSRHEMAEDGTPSLHARRWQHLLGWLGENRSRRPLNGVVLTVDLVRLVTQSPEERKQVQASIRSRLEEMTRQLGTRLPVYVVLSKIDLLEGFEQFLGRLPAEVRDEVMGFTFSLPATHSHDLWLEEFDHNYARFVTRFGEHLLDALCEPSLTRQRHSLFAVSRQLAGMRNLLSAFLLNALSAGQYASPVLMRGVYFSSVYQQGVLLNSFVEAAAEAQGLDMPIASTRATEGNRVYFARKLFTQIIYPEAGLAGDNIRIARRKRRLLATGFGVAALGCLLAAGLWQLYFKINRDKASDVLARSQEFSAWDIATTLDTTGRNLLEPLDKIRDALSIYGDYREAWPLLSDMGLYQGTAIGPTVDAAYLNLLSKRFLPAIASGVLEAINAAPEGSNQQLAALRIYRMLEERGNRRPALVREWVARHWQRAYPGQGQLQAALLRHLDYALKYADTDLSSQRERVSQVQRQLRQQPMAERVYLTLKQEAEDRLQPALDLRNEIGPAFDIVYRPLSSDPADGGLLLAPLLTAKGFRDYFEPGARDIIELAVIDQWVLGERQKLDYSEEDRKVLTQRVRTLYSADYVDSWRQALNQFEVTDFRDLGHGVSVLEQVTGPSAPLRRLLETLRDNTLIHSGTMVAQGQAPLEIARLSDDQQQAMAIRRAFSSLSELIEARGERPSYYEETLRSVSAVYDQAKTVHDHPDSGKAALKVVLERFSLGGTDPIANLQRIATGLPEPLNQQVRKLAEQTSQVLLVAALRELEKRWNSEIYSFYRDRLANRYPFRPGGEDASLEDFEAFFGPQGRLQKFQEQYLDVFLKDNLDALYSESHGGYLVRGDVLEQLQKAERIRETFFNHRGALAVQLSIEPLALDVKRRSSLLSVDGQLIPFEHGAAQRVGLVWPNGLGDVSGSQLTLVHSTGNTASLGYRGPWSLFRLLSRGQLNARTSTSVDLTFAVAGGLMRYRVWAEKAHNPIIQRSFDGFALPRTLLQARGQDKLPAKRTTS